MVIVLLGKTLWYRLPKIFHTLRHQCRSVLRNLFTLLTTVVQVSISRNGGFNVDAKTLNLFYRTLNITDLTTYMFIVKLNRAQFKTLLQTTFMTRRLSYDRATIDTRDQRSISWEADELNNIHT